MDFHKIWCVDSFSDKKDLLNFSEWSGSHPAHWVRKETWKPVWMVVCRTSGTQRRPLANQIEKHDAQTGGTLQKHHTLWKQADSHCHQLRQGGYVSTCNLSVCLLTELLRTFWSNVYEMLWNHCLHNRRTSPKGHVKSKGQDRGWSLRCSSVSSYKQALREAATICPASCKLTFEILTLKVVSESRVTWATSVPIFVFLGLCSWLRPDVRDRQTSDVHNNNNNNNA